ncbi:hypothetical protein [Streptomyces venezuelae]|uniref:hypothetical protein n=1 Tax=Streptomyces venezuelae TaxID=54571 RepID=UPI0034491FCA
MSAEPHPAPMAASRLNALDAALNSSGALSASDARELLAEAKRAQEDSDQQYADADYWRESYRLAKGLSTDEIGAIIAIRDASKVHPRPCTFPHAACVCDD